MREMKDSGIEWIGTIPFDWKCCKQKYEIQLINGRAYSDSEFEEDGKYRILRVGNLFSNPTWYTSSLELPPDKYCENGDLLYSWSMSYAPVIWTGEKVIYHYHIWKTKLSSNLNKKFAYYYLSALTDALKAKIHETTMGFITMGVMNNSYIAFPCLKEQEIIVSFLDSKCSEIDAISADIQKEIETLEQYKRSVITEAVTKGLNPEAEMKDSGIGYIGIIPNHWVVEKIKYHLKYRGNRNPGGVQVLSVYREYGVIPKDSRDDNHNVTSEDTSNYRYVRVGDFVINKMKAWQGSMAISDYEGIVSPAYYVYEFSDEHFDRKYFHYLLRNKMYATEFLRVSGGIRVGQWDLSAYDFENTMVPMPPIKEQKKIAAFLDTKSTEIDSLIGEKKRQLEVLDSYKKSLIYEYVTGKKEVI